ncbi:hypothetical protein MMC30_007330 [Trapelia coarctata]|nr:hypothetical protein [Trapelia coarctata]
MNDEEELRYFIDKQFHFRGSAKVSLNSLRFDDVARTLNPKNVARLLRIYQYEGCLRLEREHYIPVIIDEAQLSRICQQSNVEAKSLLSGTLVALNCENIRLSCLYGQHRLAAAKEFLEPGDKWWSVDIYIQGCETSTIVNIQEEYANALNFCDGDIFRNLRYAQKEGNLAKEGRWIARLSKRKWEDVRRLQTKDNLKALNQAFDHLLDYEGLWPALQIGNFHNILAMRCPEELETYLQFIHKAWKQILQGEGRYLDFGTVHALQMRNPAHSKVDFAYIRSGMQKGELFPRINDERSRGALTERLQSIDFSIPSLYTFFEDTKWLEPCAKIIRGLLPAKFRGSIRKAMIQRYIGLPLQTNCCVELSSGAYSYIEFDEKATAALAYRQLWMYAWRHFPNLAMIAPRKDTGSSKPEIKERNPLYAQHLAVLAQKIGFESKEISALAQASCDSIITYEYLSRVRPMDLYQECPQQRANVVESIINLLNSFKPAIEAVSPWQGVEVPIIQRCGRPHQVSFDLSKRCFFTEFIYLKPTDRSMCHFLVNRDIFRAFFGRTHPLESDPAQRELHQSVPKPVQENTGPATPSNTGSRQEEQPSINVQVQTVSIEQEENLFDVPSDPEEDIEMTDFDHYAADQGQKSRQLLLSENDMMCGDHIVFYDPVTEDLYAIADGNDQLAEFTNFLGCLLDRRYFFMVRKDGQLVTVPFEKLYDTAKQHDGWIFARPQSNDNDNWRNLESNPKDILKKHRQNPLKRKRIEPKRGVIVEKGSKAHRIAKPAKASSKPKPPQNQPNQQNPQNPTRLSEDEEIL